jgi:hypothetical protein
MIMGLCGSFAVVPAFSVATHGSSAGATIQTPHPANGSDGPADGSADIGMAADPISLTAVMLSDAATAAWSGPAPAATPAGNGAAALAATTTPASPASPAKPVTPALPAGPTAPTSPAAPTVAVTPGVALPLPVSLIEAAIAALAEMAAVPPVRPAPPVAPVLVAPAVPLPVVAPALAGRSGSMAALAPTGSSRFGQATWLDTIPSGTCASNDARMGAVLTVTNNAGVSVTCRVVSTGPFVPGRIVDLAKSTFATLCPVSAGVTPVSVRW